MGLLGKKNLPEIGAAGRFVSMVANRVQQEWSKVSREVKETSQGGDSNLDDRHASYEFMLTSFACASPRLAAKQLFISYYRNK